MTIKVNDDRRYTGAASLLVPPVTSGDCVIFPTLEQLVKAEGVAGRGATVRHGVAFVKRTTAELAAACTPSTPAPTSSSPIQLIRTYPADIIGTGFYSVAGQLHLGNMSTWAACTVKVLQPVSTWAPTTIHVTAVTWASAPATVYVYVLNQYGLRNAAGLLRLLVPAP